MLNTERVAWLIVREKVVGTVFVTITNINERTIHGIYEDKRGIHHVEFSRRTGKEWRVKKWWNYLWLTQQKVKR